MQTDSGEADGCDGLAGCSRGLCATEATLTHDSSSCCLHLAASLPSCQRDRSTEGKTLLGKQSPGCWGAGIQAHGAPCATPGPGSPATRSARRAAPSAGSQPSPLALSSRRSDELCSPMGHVCTTFFTSRKLNGTTLIFVSPEALPKPINLGEPGAKRQYEKGAAGLCVSCAFP